MNKKASVFSLDGRVHDPTSPTLSRIARCGRHTTIALDDGVVLNIGSDLRVVAFLTSDVAENGSLSDLAVAAAACHDDGSLIHRFDNPLVGLPSDAYADGTTDPESSWYHTLQMALRNVDVVVTPGAWRQRRAVEAVHDGFAHLDWGCTREGIDWQGFDFPPGRLSDIHARVGELRRNRRVLDECHLVLAMLTEPGRQGHEPPLAQLLASVDAEVVRLFAGIVPPAHVAALRTRGYRWSEGENGAPRGFFVDRRQDAAQTERHFLARLLGRDQTDILERPLPASERYRLP